MPRLVRVQALCDSCRCAKARLYCAVHKENQCVDCDRRTHDEEGLRDHVRVPLDSVVTALTVCQKCDQVPASVYCESGCGVICISCDTRIISKSTRRHLHRPLRDVIANRPISFSGPSTSVFDAGTTVEPSASIPLSSPGQHTQAVTEGGAIQPMNVTTTTVTVNAPQANSADAAEPISSPENQARENVVEAPAASDETGSNAEHRNFLELLWPPDHVFFQDYEQAFDEDTKLERPDDPA